MKPRDEINRRKRFFLTLVAAGFSALVLLAFTEKHIPMEVFRLLLYLAISLFVAGNILIYIGIRCPKCKAILGYTFVFSAGKIDQCPHCRVNLDEDVL